MCDVLISVIPRPDNSVLMQSEMKRVARKNDMQARIRSIKDP